MQDDEYQFKVGDQVQLLLGGPVMVITEITLNPPGYECHWFDKYNTLQAWSNPPLSVDVLQLIDHGGKNWRDIEAGDKVKLGSNGPVLLVNTLAKDFDVPTADCIWPASEGQLVLENFPQGALRLFA